MTASIANAVFSPGKLSIGMTLPITDDEQGVVDFSEQIALAQLADRLGFRALWVRDVPLNSIDYPDPVGHLDPGSCLARLHRKRSASRLSAARSC